MGKHDAKRGCCKSSKPHFEKEYSLHLEGVMSNEEHEWLVGQLDDVVNKHFPNFMKATVLYLIFSFLPWIVYAILMSQRYFNPLIVLVPTTFQIFCMLIFISHLRRKRMHYRGKLEERVCALNQHFSNRGMNIMLKSGAGQAPFQDRVIIEVAARQQQQQQQQHAPQL